MSEQLPELTVEEWDAAMATVMAAHDDEVKQTPPATAMTNMPKKSGPKRRAAMKTHKPSRPAKADEDLDRDVADNLSMPDGSFFIQSPGDLRAKIDGLKNAEQTASVPPGRAYALDVKAHIIQRADQMKMGHMVPDAWRRQVAANPAVSEQSNDVEPDSVADVTD